MKAKHSKLDHRQHLRQSRHGLLLEAPLWENRMLGHQTQVPNSRGTEPWVACTRTKMALLCANCAKNCAIKRCMGSLA